ncbi:hypothetical protein [Serratia quinivorans]|uniref:hypothetical protein n=1 Tax=Serratia quinivorans TaxID=137545 RepID=UPI00217CB9F1|nr:hypothetical protein [Serratia quinivorans]CAI1121951.1 Uncharacterised protein [Serratia quinivorans]CAI1152226.1 Uncharacterised protein [Serratia quinivorans]CAI1831652.1 Uncharacterised protein [Serratia quinivorans]CAI2140024.1 Uncharacterised protein [Serratia quinivorans]CAI2150273.1 Uncharacterised protein [Serratia quinivorans]
MFSTLSESQGKNALNERRITEDRILLMEPCCFSAEGMRQTLEQAGLAVGGLIHTSTLVQLPLLPRY